MIRHRYGGAQPLCPPPRSERSVLSAKPPRQASRKYRFGDPFARWLRGHLRTV